MSYCVSLRYVPRHTMPASPLSPCGPTAPISPFDPSSPFAPCIPSAPRRPSMPLMPSAPRMPSMPSLPLSPGMRLTFASAIMLRMAITRGSRLRNLLTAALIFSFSLTPRLRVLRSASSQSHRVLACGPSSHRVLLAVARSWAADALRPTPSLPLQQS